VTSRLLAEAARAKDEAHEALGRGQATDAERLMRAEIDRLAQAMEALPNDTPQMLRDRLLEEQTQLDKLARGARDMDSQLARKSLTEDLLLQQRGRDDVQRRTRARNKRDY
jgi:hypothetical protein